MHDSRVIANRFIELARADRGAFTPMQLLKLVYIAHGWMLGLYGRPLIKDDIQAWQYGPVIPRLYNEVREYKGSPVTKSIANVSGEAIDRQEDSIIEQVYDRYGHMSGIDLSAITHAPNTPWSQTYVPGVFATPIGNDLIQHHYQHLIRQRQPASQQQAGMG